MSLTAKLIAGVEAAFAAAGDLVQAVTWRKQVAVGYDPIAGVQSFTITETKVRAIEEDIKAGDYLRLGLSAKAVRLWIPATDFGAVDPAHDDKLVHRGVTYTLKACRFQGVKALWEVHADV